MVWKRDWRELLNGLKKINNNIMKVLITGGAGFIGSNLSEELTKETEVIVLDNLHTGNLKNLKGINAKIITKSCSEIPNLEFGNLDFIFHLGVPSSSPMYKENPCLVGEAINDFIKILELAKKNNCPVIYASTSSIYNGNPVPWKEDLETKVSDFYTEARYSMERLAELYFQLYEVPSIGLRFFSVYGPKEETKGEYANLVSQFLWVMEKNEQPVIYGDGSQRRDLTFVSDIVKGCLLSMKKLEKEKICAIYNLGTGKNYSLNEVIELLNKILGKNIKPKYIENPIKNYVVETLADTSKAEKELGFKAKIELEDGINKSLW